MTSKDFWGAESEGLSHNRQRTPRQMDDKFRKLEEIKQQAAATQRLIEEQGADRQRRADDLRRRDTERRSFLETRKSLEPERETFRRDERELRHEVKRKNEQGSIALAFNSISPQKFDEGDSGSTRRSTSTYNVSASVPSSDEKPKNVVRTSSASVSNENRYRNRAKSLLGLDAAGIADEPMSQSFHGGSSAFRRRTDIMPTIPSPHRDLRPRSGNLSLSVSMHEHVSRSPVPSPKHRVLQHASNNSRSMSHLNVTPQKRETKVENVSQKNTDHRRSMGSLGPDQENVTPKSAVQRKTSLSTPRLTRAERLRQRAKQIGAEKKMSSVTQEANAVMRSGDVTPVVPSRPLSAMSYRSHSGSSGTVSMRQRPLVSRRPRPASMAGTGILVSTPEQQKDKIEKKGEETKAPKARLPTVGPKPYRAKSMDVLGTSPKPLSVHKRPKAATPRAGESQKSEVKTSAKSTEVVKTEKVAIKHELKGTKSDMKVKPLGSDKAKVVHEGKPSPKAGLKTKAATPGKTKSLLLPKVEVKEEPIDINEDKVAPHPTVQNTTELLIKTEPEIPVDVRPSVEEISLPVEEPKAEQNVENSVVDESVKEEPRSVTNSAAIPVPAPVPAPAAIPVAVPASVTMSASAPEFQPGKPKITSEEEAKAAIAEKRRLAREQMEREAELERQRLEAERLAEEERLRQEEEQARKEAEEMDRLVKEAKKVEEERLRIAIEEAERREAEETQKREEEARLKVEKEIADKKAKEEAEKLRKENEERLRKEEEARIERKKRVEAIMSRTRGAKQGQGENSGDDKSLSSVASSDPSSGPVSLVDERAEDQIQPLMEEELIAKKNEINLKKEQEDQSSVDPNEVNGNSSELNGVNGHGKENSDVSSLNGRSALINFNSLENDINSEIKDKSIIGAETLVELNQEIIKPVTRDAEASDLLM